LLDSLLQEKIIMSEETEKVELEQPEDSDLDIVILEDSSQCKIIMDDSSQSKDALSCKVCSKMCVRGVSLPCCGTQACRNCATVKVKVCKFKCWNCESAVVMDDLVNDTFLRAAVNCAKTGSSIPADLINNIKDRLSKGKSQKEAKKRKPIVFESNEKSVESTDQRPSVQTKKPTQKPERKPIVFTGQGSATKSKDFDKAKQSAKYGNTQQVGGPSDFEAGSPKLYVAVETLRSENKPLITQVGCCYSKTGSLISIPFKLSKFSMKNPSILSKLNRDSRDNSFIKDDGSRTEPFKLGSGMDKLMKYLLAIAGASSSAKVTLVFYTVQEHHEFIRAAEFAILNGERLINKLKQIVGPDVIIFEKFNELQIGAELRPLNQLVVGNKMHEAGSLAFNLRKAFLRPGMKEAHFPRTGLSEIQQNMPLLSEGKFLVQNSLHFAQHRNQWFDKEGDRVEPSYAKNQDKHLSSSGENVRIVEEYAMVVEESVISAENAVKKVEDRIRKRKAQDRTPDIPAKKTSKSGCFNCGSTSHIKALCPTVPGAGCHQCGSLSHVVARCPDRRGGAPRGDRQGGAPRAGSS